MLRKRSRPSSCKQALMADFGTTARENNNPSPRSPLSSLFSSPRLFTGFTSKGLLSDSDSLMSPTSILRCPFWPDSTISMSPRTYSENKLRLEKLDSRNVGLGLIDALVKTGDLDSDSKVTKPQLKVQIPTLHSSADFGIKTRNHSQGLSPSSFGKKSPFENSNSRNFRALSITEMELSEDYTCVISHGPNPKTIHIFDDCIVERCNGGGGGRLSHSVSYPSESFLSFCYNCRKNLSHGKDIYMYRGEKAFCSSECRDKEMKLEEEGLGISECHDAHGIGISSSS